MVWGLGIVALLFGLGWLAYRPSTYRYKMTVEVDTPAGSRTGFAVREVTYVPSLPLLAASGFSLKQRGEAVAVDLQGGQALFVPLQTDGHETIRAGFGQGRETDVKALLDRAKGDRKVYVYPSLPALKAHNSSYPPMVRFRDAADPATVERVDPADLAASFGAGVLLKRLTLQATDEPITSGITTRLPWWQKLSERKARLNGNTSIAVTTNDLADNMGPGDFSAGVSK